MGESSPDHSQRNLARSSSKKIDINLIKPLLLKHPISFVAGIVSVFCVISSFYLLGPLLRQLVEGGATLNLSTFGLCFSIVCLMALGSFGRTYYFSTLAEKSGHLLRSKLFSHLVSLDIPFFHYKKPGEVMAYFTSDIAALQTSIEISIPILIRNVAMFMLGVGMMVYISPKLFLLVMGALFFAILPTIKLAKRLKKWTDQAHHNFSKMSGYLGEVFSHMGMVQAFCNEDRERKHFEETNNILTQTMLKRSLRRSALVVFVMMTIFLVLSFVTYFSIYSVEQGLLSHADMANFILFSVLSLSAFPSFSEIMTDLQKASSASKRLLNLFNQTSSIKVLNIRKSLKQTGALVFQKVSFSYQEDKKILHDINIAIHPGETIAIVGPSGAGKSTLFNLLLRFYDPQSGSLYMDGVPLKELSLSYIRNAIGLVPQEPTIFSDTILNNVTYGNENADIEDVKKALEKVRLLDWAESTPDGLNTYVGYQGLKISGGQRQRLAIARLMLKNPKVLLLDEATSALDSESEHVVQKALKELSNNKTTLVIAHRLSTVLSADKIIVMDQGKVQAMAPHEELLKISPLYQRLVKFEFSNALSA